MNRPLSILLCLACLSASLPPSPPKPAPVKGAQLLMSQPTVAKQAFTAPMVPLVVPPPTNPPPSVPLAWDASPDPTVTGYNLYMGGASKHYTNVLAAGNALTATESNLVQGATYYFAATDYNANGIESAHSAEVAYTVPAPLTNRVDQAWMQVAGKVTGPWSDKLMFWQGTNATPGPFIRIRQTNWFQ